MVIIVTNFFTSFRIHLLSTFQENHFGFTTLHKKSHAKYQEISSYHLMANYTSLAEERMKEGSEGRKGGRFLLVIHFDFITRL